MSEYSIEAPMGENIFGKQILHIFFNLGNIIFMEFYMEKNLKGIANF